MYLSTLKWMDHHPYLLDPPLLMLLKPRHQKEGARPDKVSSSVVVDPMAMVVEETEREVKRERGRRWPRMNV